MKKCLFFLFLISVSPLFSQVTLNFSSSNADAERNAVIRYLFDAFELYHPGISVNIIHFDDNDAIESIINDQDSLSPDIIMADSLLLNRISGLAELDHTLTSQLIRELDETDFYRGALGAFQTEGRQIGIPYSAWLQVLWYRQDWFRSGLVGKPDATDSLLKSASFFSSLSDTGYGLILGSENDVYLLQCFLHIAQSMGLQLLKDRRGWYVSESVFTEAAGLYRTLLGFTPPGDDYWRSRDFYFQNKSAMLYYSTHLMDDLVLRKVAENSLTGQHFEQLSGSEFTMNLFKNTDMLTTLEGSRRSSFGSVSGLGLFKSSEKAKNAALKELVRFLYRPDVYMTWLHMSPGGMLPVRPSVLENDNFYRDSSGVLKLFGRKKIRELTSGLENLNVFNAALLGLDAGNEYEENGFQNLLYEIMHSDREISEFTEKTRWIR